jgi:hypothetical protein
MTRFLQSMEIAALVLVVPGCRSPTPPPEPVSTPGAEDGQPEPQVQSSEHEALCLPVVSGCGCAYVCGESIRRNADGMYEVVHDFLDSTTVIATVERWCFDTAGHGSPALPTEGTRCRDVFFDRSPCGGECIPTTAYLGCRVVEGRCVAGRGSP